jgi:hypothetical protein
MKNVSFYFIFVLLVVGIASFPLLFRKCESNNLLEEKKSDCSDKHIKKLYAWELEAYWGNSMTDYVQFQHSQFNFTSKNESDSFYHYLNTIVNASNNGISSMYIQKFAFFLWKFGNYSRFHSIIKPDIAYNYYSGPLLLLKNFTFDDDTIFDFYGLGQVSTMDCLQFEYIKPYLYLGPIPQNAKYFITIYSPNIFRFNVTEIDVGLYDCKLCGIFLDNKAQKSSLILFIFGIYFLFFILFVKFRKDEIQEYSSLLEEEQV